MKENKRLRKAEVDYDYRDLLTYRALVFSNTLGKGAMRFYGDTLRVSLAEWRLIAALARSGSISLPELATELSIDKAWISRTVSSLSAKGFVSTSSDASHATKLILCLSESGLKLYRETIPLVVQRQELLLKALTNEERIVFSRALAKLQQRAIEMLSENPEDFGEGAD